MSRAGDFVPSTTYFVEREQRLTNEIETAKAALDEVTAKYNTLTRDLVAKRDEILTTVARLVELRDDLGTRSRQARENALDLNTMAVQLDTISHDLEALIAPEKKTVEEIDAEIASISKSLVNKVEKPHREMARLQDRLVRLRLRKSIASRNAAEPLVVLGDEHTDVADHLVARHSQR